MDTATGRWVPCGKADKDTTEMKVSGLEPGKKYQFRVKAINNEGESEPLETERSTLAKNPYDEPGPPGMPVITDYDKDFVVLKWDEPIKDGGAPITGYIIEKKDKYSHDWTPAAEVVGNKTEGKVDKLQEGDKYEFRVRAVNKAGPGEPSEATAPHLMKHKNLKPRIDRTNLRNLTIKVGQAVNFDVDIIGEPPPTVTWEHVGKGEVKSDEVYQVDNVDYNTKFNILRATRKETGVYKVKATNASGTDEAEVEINVLGKPGKPNGPLEVSNVRKDGCSLSWKKPDDDGGCPIECYEVEKLDEETGRWVPAGKVHGAQAGGDSDELETDTSTLAKNPFDEPGKPGRPEPTDWDSDHSKSARKARTSGRRPKEVPGTSNEATVSDLEEGEEYEFRVIAINKEGPSEPSDASRSVVAKPRKLAPKIDRTNLKDTTIKSGQSLKLDVDVKGEPCPTIEWSFNGQPLKASDKIKLDIEDYHTLFILTGAKRAHTGTYTITAKNMHGTDEASIQLKVLSKPSKPKGPLEVSDVTAEGCKLKWDKPGR
ncbi:hypothetical protein MRX96_017668 [Rhipicephalus microplus]